MSEHKTETHPHLDPDKTAIALASRHADGRWPTYITPPTTRPPAWAGLPGEPDDDQETQAS